MQTFCIVKCHAKLESTIEHLGVEIEDVLRISDSCDG